ncbi:MAG: Stk1 family PASTA domain-containing Ser/Thr kinase [Firmicutes bacterium]|nr:Stk1 family PASTA domain-containing Ser/Thr kinase [Bacillota bacterium]
MIGKLFNERYQIQEKLGSGGTSVVYKGQDILLNRKVTIKILREEYASNDEFVRRFRREAQAVASLSHGNIVSVYDVGFEENMHYIVMEFVEGHSLKEYIKQKGVLTVQIASVIMMQILDGISYAHEHGIIHRDIKPHNILLSKDGRAKVTDFGIAVGMTDMTQTYNTSSRIMGSVHYIAPEQVQGQPVTEKSDIYSAGVVFYEMLTGQLPFSGDTPISIAMQHVQAELILPHQLNTKVPMGLSYVVMRAMRKNPDTRYDNVREMMEAIRNATEGLNSVYVPLPEENLENTRKLTAILPVKDMDIQLEPNKSLANLLKRSPKEHTAAPKTPEPDYRSARTAPRRRISAMSVILVLLLLAFAATMIWAVGQLRDLFFGNDIQVADNNIIVPYVVDMDLDKAEAILVDLGLVPRTERRNDENILINTVMRQNVPADSKVKPGSDILLTVSDGPRLTEVPGVVGETERMAVTKLTNRGLNFEYTEPEYSEDFLAGEIIRQDPVSGARVAGGTSVLLTVSLGIEPIPAVAPKVIEETLEDAKALLIEAGLRVGSIKYEESSKYYADIVINQSVAPAAELNQDDTVDLIVSRGPGPVVIAKSTTVYFEVPDDGISHHISIEVEDSRGITEAFNQSLSPGYSLQQMVTYFSPATIFIYCDGILKDQTNI